MAFYVKTEFRFEILEVKNLQKVPSLMVLGLSVIKL